jgi:hypothetical protein
MNFNCDFSLNHYFEVLDYAKKSHVIGPIKDFYKLLEHEKFIALRHDVDVSVTQALELATLESQHNVSSTYFILLHSPYYNALSNDSIDKIKQMLQLGHEIGLHYDSTFIESDDKILDMVTKEARILGNLIKHDITSIAPHNVSITDMKINYEHLNFIDPTDPKILNSVKYISDSVQNWRNNCMCHHIDNESKLIILTHPIWWSQEHTSRDKILENFKTMQIENLQKLLQETKQSHISYFKKLKTGKIL